MKADVTVLIASFNPGRYLCEALGSLLSQSHENWKAIVIDDASTDDSLKLAGEFFRDPRITLLRNPVNLGQSKSLNRGLMHVDTPYTVTLDSDDWFYKDTLKVLLAASRHVPDRVAVISGNICMVTEDKNGNAKNRRIVKGRGFKDRYDFLLANCSLWPRFYRTSALRQIGGWPTDDPYQGRYMEDRRVLLRLVEHFDFYWVDQVLYGHRRHGGNQTNLAEQYNHVTEWAVKDALRRWGNKYRPVFATNSSNRLVLSRLIPRTR